MSGSKAVVPTTMPGLPKDCAAWARSTKRPGGVYHAHTLGLTACRRLVLDRNRSETATGLGDMQYWGACPRCFRLSKEKDQ